MHWLPSSVEIFAKAQEIIEKRRQLLTDEQVLERLAALRARKGHLSHKLIAQAGDVPDTSTLIRRFGSLTATYKRVGFQTASRYRWLETEARMRSLINTAMAQIVTQLAGRRIQASFKAQDNLLSLDGNKVTVTIGSARCLCEGPASKRWRVRVERDADTLLTLICRMNETNTVLHDYYLLPSHELARTRVKRLRITSRAFANSSQLKTIAGAAVALRSYKIANQVR